MTDLIRGCCISRGLLQFVNNEFKSLQLREAWTHMTTGNLIIGNVSKFQMWHAPNVTCPAYFCNSVYKSYAVFVVARLALAVILNEVIHTHSAWKEQA